MRRHFIWLWLLLLVAVAPAQMGEEYVQVEIYNSRPYSVLVRAGQKPDVVRLYGRGFELVKKVQIQLKGAVVKNISAELKNISQGMADLKVQADSTAIPGEDYQVIFFTPTRSYPMDLGIEVAQPDE